MNSCDEYAIKALRYLDNELEEQELKDFLWHLASCASCREQLDAERDLSAILHRSRPLYSAPAALRSRVSAAVAEGFPSADRTPGPFFHTLADSARRLPGRRVLAPAAIALGLCLVLVPSIVRNVRAANYVEAAVAEHRSYLDGSLPLGLQSNSPELVTAWFAKKLPFDFRLPAAEPSPEGKPAYRLTGAAQVSYKGNPAALVTYETQNEKISLLVASNSSAAVAGGDEIRFGELTFHYHNESGFRVITWSNHGLSYALVSSVSGPAQTSCLVCHQSMADRSNFKVRQ
jgi:mycothiol system anti-sigma-R factor